MRLFKKKPDVMSQVALLIDAYKSSDKDRIQSMLLELAPRPTMDLLFGLYQFGQIIGTRLTPKQKLTASVLFATTIFQLGAQIERIEIDDRWPEVLRGSNAEPFQLVPV